MAAGVFACLLLLFATGCYAPAPPPFPPLPPPALPLSVTSTPTRICRTSTPTRISRDGGDDVGGVFVRWSHERSIGCYAPAPPLDPLDTPPPFPPLPPPALPLSVTSTPLRICRTSTPTRNSRDGGDDVGGGFVRWSHERSIGLRPALAVRSRLSALLNTFVDGHQDLDATIVGIIANVHGLPMLADVIHCILVDRRGGSDNVLQRMYEVVRRLKEYAHDREQELAIPMRYELDFQPILSTLPFHRYGLYNSAYLGKFYGGLYNKELLTLKDLGTLRISRTLEDQAAQYFCRGLFEKIDRFREDKALVLHTLKGFFDSDVRSKWISFFDKVQGGLSGGYEMLFNAMLVAQGEISETDFL